MSSTLLDFILCGFTYVLLSYFLGIWAKSKLTKASGGDEGEGIDLIPPVLDLPPGVSLPKKELAESEYEGPHWY